jgi:hypothetical protein
MVGYKLVKSFYGCGYDHDGRVCDRGRDGRVRGDYGRGVHVQHGHVRVGERALDDYDHVNDLV